MFRAWPRIVRPGVTEKYRRDSLAKFLADKNRMLFTELGDELLDEVSNGALGLVEYRANLMGERGCRATNGRSNLKNIVVEGGGCAGRRRPGGICPRVYLRSKVAQPRNGLAQGPGLEVVPTVLAIFTNPGNSGLAKNLELLRDRGLGETCFGDEIGDAQFSIAVHLRIQ